MIRLLSILVLVLTLNSCGVSYRINSYDTNTINEDLYNVEVIETSNQLRWKLQTDWDFANNYYWFLQRQNYSFFQNQYYRNRLYRFGWYSPHDYWMNWQWNWHSGYGYNNYNNWNGYYGWNHWNSGWNNYHYSSWRYYGNHPYYRGIYGRRSNNLGNVFNRNNRIRVYNNTSRRVPRSTQNNNRIIRNVTPRINPTIKPRVRPTIKPRVRPITRPTTRPTTTTRSSNRGVPKYSKRRNN